MASHGARIGKWGAAGLTALAAVMALSACSDTRKSLIQGKRAPDEFAVYSRAPLSIPPEFGLRPPTPGAVRAEGKDPTGQAYQAMTGRVPPQAAVAPQAAFAGTQGERALLGQANAMSTDPNIRDTVNRETSILAEESLTVTERLLYPGESKAVGPSVDPAKEAQRLKENQALGKPLNEGDVPTIRRTKKGLLEGLFN